jgi:hypothetical protein
MVDTFSSHGTSITSPPGRAAQVTPDDANDLPFFSRALYIGTPGDVRVRTLEGDEVTYKNLVGTKVLRVSRIFATGTTAADIISEW